MSHEKSSLEVGENVTPVSSANTKNTGGALLTNDDESSNEPHSENGVNGGTESPVRAVQQLCKDPSFAMVCSYFNKFGALLGIKPQHFTKIERMLTSFHETGKVDRELIDLHLTLLRKLNFKSARASVWEKFVLKFCSMIPGLETEFHQLERYGYLNTTPATKLAILKTLCESQFDFNLKFKEVVTNSFNAKDLRILPVGVDRKGLAYWYQQDSDSNIRVYTEEQDDHSGGSWNLVAKSKEELEQLVDKLKSACAPSERSRLNAELEGKASTTNGVHDGGVSYAFEVTIKRGTLLDTFQDESVIKKKEVVPPKTPITKGKKKSEVVDEDEELHEQNNEIPEELMPFIDRRVLPRRSARNAAISHLKELTTPMRKRLEKSAKEVAEGGKKRGRPPLHKDQRNAPSAIPEHSSPQGSDEEEDDLGDDGDDCEDEFAIGDGESEEGSSDDEFMPLSEIRKRAIGSKRRYRGRRKRKALLDPDEMDHDEDDEGEEEVKKERKKATDETLCMKCRKSSNPEVLLLCDMCDDAWHTWCVHPMLWFVPDDDWFCPKCQHSMLIQKLSSVLLTLAEQLKRKAADDKRKEAAAERLKREMEYIGVSLNNIIPTSMDLNNEDSASSTESDEDDGERKSKKRANRCFGMRPTRPIIPIALGRSRRHVAKVDYRFGAYDDLIQEAMESIDESSTKPKITGDPARPQGGAGKGKDMANILNAQEKSKSAGDDSAASSDKPKGSKVGKPAKSHRRLNDLNVDEMTESDASDEYRASEEGSEASEPISEGSDEYVPSDGGRRKAGRRTRSDDDFVVSESDSDYAPARKKSRKSKSSKKLKKKKRSRRGRGRRISSDEDSSSEEVSDFVSDGSSDEDSRKRRRCTFNSKWAPRASGSDDDSEGTPERTATGRLARKSATKVKKIIEEMDDEEEEGEKPDESADSGKPEELSKEERKRSGDSDFEPNNSDDEEEEDDDDDDEDEEDEDEEDEDEEENENEKQEDVPSHKSKDGSSRERKGEAAEKCEDSHEKERQIEAKEDDQKASTPTTEPKTITPIVLKEITKKEISDDEAENVAAGTSASPTQPTDWKVDDTLDIKKEPVEQSSPSASMSPDPTHVRLIAAAPYAYSAPSTSASMLPPQYQSRSVIQQMAQFAGPPGARYPSVGVNTSSIPCGPGAVTSGPAPIAVSSIYGTFPATAADKLPYMGAPPAGMYNVRAMGYLKQSPSAAPLAGFVPISEGWSSYPLPPNVFPPSSSMPPSSVAQASGTNGTPNLPVSDADSLSNALASAMDY